MNANYLLYLLDLFEGKIGINELITIDIKLLNEMKKLQEEKIKGQNDRLMKMERERNKEVPKYTNSKGEVYSKPDKK